MPEKDGDFLKTRHYGRKSDSIKNVLPFGPKILSKFEPFDRCKKLQKNSLFLAIWCLKT